MEKNIEPLPYVTGVFNSLIYPNNSPGKLILQTDASGDNFADYQISHDIAVYILEYKAVLEGVSVTLSNYQKDRYHSISFKGLEIEHHPLYVKNKTKDMSDLNQDQDVVDMMIDPKNYGSDIRVMVNGLVAENHGRWMNVFENTRLPAMVKHYVDKYLKEELSKINVEQQCCTLQELDHSGTYTDRVMNVNGKQYKATSDLKPDDVEMPVLRPRYDGGRSLFLDKLFEEHCQDFAINGLVFDHEMGEAVFTEGVSVVDLLRNQAKELGDGSRLHIALLYALRVLSA